MARRSYRWAQIAQAARQAPGVWRRHPDLIAVTPSLEAHARRRVSQLWGDDDGTFEFTREHASPGELGVRTFDLLVRWNPTQGES